MLSIVLVTTLVVSVLLYLHHNQKSTRKKQNEKIQEAWSGQKKGLLNFDLIGRYSAQASGNEYHQLSAQTIFDIDFYELFRFIDRTISRIGQQYLFKKVIHPESNLNVLQKLSESADFFTKNSIVREEVQRELSRLSDSDAYYIASLLKGQLLKKPKWFKFIPISVAIILILMVSSIYYPVLLLVLMIPVAGNMFIHYWNKENIFLFVRSLPQLNILIDVCSKISKKHIRFHDNSAEKSISNLGSFRRRVSLVGFSSNVGIQGELSQVSNFFIELLKSIFLIEVFTLFHLVHEVETQKESITFLFNYAGDIDMALSVAALRAGSLNTCLPSFTSPGKKLLTKNMYHPLIRDCIKNDIVLSKSVLITGSNMSGKTTFLRILLINSILAQTIYTCFASEFETPVLKQFSSIRIDDSLLEGKSFYFEEVNVMGSLVKEVSSGDQNIFVLDEVFKGTNTVERIAAAKAVLSYLNRNDNIVIVSTHDIELSHMLEDEYDLYHFSESFENEDLYFDHKLKFGRLKTRNAIRILEISNYPKEVTDEARRLSNLLGGIPGNNAS